MKNSGYLVFRSTVGLLVLMANVSVSAQAMLTLIGPSVGNGSFEDGNLEPWTGVGGVVISQEPNFASHGDWFAVISGSPAPPSGSIARPSIFQRPVADSTDGLTFLLTFDVRNGSTGFDGIRVFFAALNEDTTVAFTTNTFLDQLPIEWQSHQLEFQVPAVWQTGQLSLGFQFEKMGAVVGTTYTGYLDNVVLQQVPEPATWTLLAGGLCGILAGIRLVRKRRLNLTLSARQSRRTGSEDASTPDGRGRPSRTHGIAFKGERLLPVFRRSASSPSSSISPPPTTEARLRLLSPGTFAPAMPPRLAPN